MPQALLALGANLGDRQQTLTRAVALLQAHGKITAGRCSRWRETAAIGGPPGQPLFLNGAVLLDTTLPAVHLQAVLGSIEHTLGRRRDEHWGARSLDLDLLLYAGEVIDTPALVVPHPRMAFRRFVLEPASEVARDMVHPTIGWTIGRLLQHLDTALPYVAILGPPASGKTALAESVATNLGCRRIADPAIDAAHAVPIDSSGPDLARQIQFLDCRARLLDREHWPSGLAVSDFYWDQSLAYAALQLDARGFAAFETAWQHAAELTVSPKLLVALKLPRSARQGADDASGELSEGLNDELSRLAARRGIGPVLYLAGDDPRAQLDEVSAAIEAMN